MTIPNPNPIFQAQFEISHKNDSSYQEGVQKRNFCYKSIAFTLQDFENYCFTVL